MTITTAQAILKKNGVLWNNYAELEFIILNTTNERIKTACEVAKRFMDNCCSFAD